MTTTLTAPLVGTSVTVEGIGLITGQAVSVTVTQAPPGHGIVFYLEADLPLPARLECVVHTDRGVTLGHPSGKTLSIVEHFLAACALLGLSNLKVTVSKTADMSEQAATGFELPILDGSTQPWITALQQGFSLKPGKILPNYALTHAVSHSHGDSIRIYAVPATHFKLSYAVDFEHPDLATRWVHWDSLQEGPEALAAAQTFGYVAELPILQAKGLAKGVSDENCLGLTDAGGYTRSLRLEDEPIRHKMLDCLGDLMLMGINPLQTKAHVFAINAGHGSHTAFAKKLLPALSPLSATEFVTA